MLAGPGLMKPSSQELWPENIQDMTKRFAFLRIALRSVTHSRKCLSDVAMERSELAVSKSIDRQASVCMDPHLYGSCIIGEMHGGICVYVFQTAFVLCIVRTDDDVCWTQLFSDARCIRL